MNSFSIRRGSILLGILLALYCVIGFTGFDPSKQDEAYIFGIVLEYWRGQHWVVPMLAGVPLMEKPPLYYLVAKTFIDLLPWLPLHDAARLSSGFFIGISGLAVAGAARLAWGTGFGRFGVLALFSALGLTVPAHMLLTDNANLAGMSIVLLGFAATAVARPWAGFALGTGTGIAFLAKGILGPGLVVFTALLLLLFPNWRTRLYGRSLFIALLFAAPWLFVWPTLLYRQSPALFLDWFWQNNLGRFFGFAPDYLNAVHQGDFWYTILPWATFPILPLALISLQQRRRDQCRSPAVQLGITSVATLLAVLLASASVRAIYALPLLPPLALLAAPTIRNPPVWFARLTTAAGWILFIVLGAMSWLIWQVLVSGSIPSYLSVATTALTPYLHMPVSRGHVIAAIFFTGIWIAGQWVWRHATWRSSAVWYSSLLCTMALAWLLWIPWMIASKSSYRPLYEKMAAALPHDTCVSSLALGESQRGMLDYVLSLKTIRERDANAPHCNALLIDTSESTAMPELAAEWRLVFSGKRAADDHEKFLLYVRSPSAPTQQQEGIDQLSMTRKNHKELKQI